MTTRTTISLIGLLVLTYAATPLVAINEQSPDICCTGTQDCPDQMLCAASEMPCSLEAEGHCVPIPQD